MSVPTNTVHFACFDCRKAFKQRGSSNWDADVPVRPYPCPNCKRPMARLGRYFKPPSQRAIRQWLKVELLYHYGERFESGNLGLDAKCRTLGATLSYLTAQGHSEAEVQQILDHFRASHQTSRDRR